MPQRMLADREERRLGAMLCQGGEHGARIVGPGAVVEREHHLLHEQEVVHLVLLEAEPGAAGGVDLDRAGNAERVGISGTLGGLGALGFGGNDICQARGE